MVSDERPRDVANDVDSLGVFDGDDYKTLVEMEECKSQDSISFNNLPNNVMYKNAKLDVSNASTIIGKDKQ